jgi:MSHA biogenesis protein MshP
MHLNHSPQQHGFAVMAALFILVVLTSLGAYVVSISSAQHIGNALDIQGSRALQAARAGMDWGIARAVHDPTAFGTGNCQTGSVTVDLSTGTGGDFAALAGFTVSVTCVGTPETDGADLVVYSLTATACDQPNAGRCPNVNNPGDNYVERRLTTQVICNASGIC